MGRHVVLGTGPAGCWIARALCDMHHDVLAVNLNGARPDLMPSQADVIAADVSDPTALAEAVPFASVIYQALNPPYNKWHQLFPALQASAIDLARETGARYVSIDNLYMYDASSTITEDSAVEPRSKKGELRARMAEAVLEAHEVGQIRAAILRSSDYYGPGVTQSGLAERVFGNLIAGKKAQVLGSATQPHSFAYIEDVGRAAAMLGTSEEALGRVWIAPHAAPLTQGEMVEKACAALEVPARMSVVTPLMLRLAGLFDSGARQMVEMAYTFTEPFVVDSSRIERAFPVPPTRVDTAIARTARWYFKHKGEAP